MQRAAPIHGTTVVTDVMIERTLPVLLKLAAGDEDHVGVGEAFHVTAEVTAIPRFFHAADQRTNCLFFCFRMDRVALDHRTASRREREEKKHDDANTWRIRGHVISQAS